MLPLTRLVSRAWYGIRHLTTPLVGVGLVYTPPYLPQVPFSVAYMNLCEWRDAQVASENWLVGTRLMFIHASEASEFLPVAEGHRVLLDASATEVLGDIIYWWYSFLDFLRRKFRPHQEFHARLPPRLFNSHTTPSTSHSQK